MNALQALKVRLLEADDLEHAASLLHWDQTTYMPPAGAAARGRQIATLSKRAHEHFIAPETGRLLDEANRSHTPPTSADCFSAFCISSFFPAKAWHLARVNNISD